MLAAKLERTGATVILEPTVPCAPTFLKPDVLYRKGDVAHILDVTIASDGSEAEAYQAKMQKYGSDVPIRAFKRHLLAAFSVSLPAHAVIPVVISQRGLWYGPSVKALRNLGLSDFDLGHISFKTMLGSLSTYAAYSMGTFRL